MIRRIGCRAHDYGKDTIELLTKKMSNDGYQTTQLALKKALKGVDDFDGVLVPANATSIKDVMLGADMDISVLGAYLNYGHPEDLVWSQNIDLLKRHIEMAKTMGARMVGTETGSVDPDYKAHADNHGEAAFQRFKEAISQVMPLVHKHDTYMAVEAVAHHIIHTPKRMTRLINEIDDQRLKVIFDINNLLTEDNWQQQETLIHEMFDLLEDRIIAVHVKDFDFVQGEKVILPIGQGKLALNTLMSRVAQSPQAIDVLSENVPKDYLAKAYETLATFVASDTQ